MAKTVLLVDDSMTQAFSIKLSLERAGYRALGAIDGQTALNVLANELPDIVVTDVIMPKMDGYELSRTIKGNPGLARIPVIVMSMLGETTDPSWQAHAGADLYISKTLDTSRLVQAVEQLLAA